MQQPVTRLPKVIVQGAALAEPKPVDTADITRITAQDLEQQQATLVSALQRIPGAYVTQGAIQESRISLRGTGGGNTTIIRDGMPINDSGGFDGAMNLSRWTVDDMAEIQVIRGPMGSLYGPGGMGGVILIETKKGQGPHKTFAKAEGGSFRTMSHMVGMQGQKGFMDYYVMGSRLQSAGPTITPDRFLPHIQGKSNNPFHQENFSARLGAGQESAHISLVSRYMARRLGYRQTPNALYPWRQNYSESFNRLQGHLENATGKWRHDIGLGYYQNGLGSTHPTSSKVVRNATQAQIDWRQTYEVTDKLQVQGVTHYSQEKLYWYKMPSLNNTFQVSHGGAGVSLSYRPFGNFMVTGAGRIDKYQGISPAVIYRLGSQYAFEKITVKGGVGTAFKGPTLQQKFYVESGFLRGNPDLKPERSLGWDLGIERPFFQNRLTLGVTLFQNRIQDLIGMSPSFRPINMSNSRTQGAEGLMRLHLTSEWLVEVSHTYTQAWDVATRKPLVGNPLNKTVFCLSGQVASAWQVSGNILYVGPQHSRDAINGLETKISSYTLVGIETSCQLNDQWQIYGRAENLLNRRYEIPRSFQQPGLGVYMGVRAQC